jgi:exodeoxyribonuclease-3
MKIATWNVNSIKARLPNVLDWLRESAPDIACLQELKCMDEAFPRLEIEDLGYNVATHGQKTYNGVALLSKLPLEDVMTGLPGSEGDDIQARYIEATVSHKAGALRIASLYLPNGNPVDTEKYTYKLAWMERLRQHASSLLDTEDAFILAGDYNVIPGKEDVHDPDAWWGDALYRPETLAQFRGLLNLGLTNGFKSCSAEEHQYSFWDYQGGAWAKDHGILIDHLLLSPQAADHLTGAGIDRFTRGWEKPSDHVPVWIELDN